MVDAQMREIDDELPDVPDEDDDEEVDFDADAVGKSRQITDDGGVVKEVLVAGSGWEKPEKGDEVFVHYVGTLEDGTKFDSSRDRGDPFTFKLGEGGVIKGWDKGVASMKKGEKSKFIIKSEYGYGASGSPPKIPPNATLIFEIELLHWKSVKDISNDGGVVKTIVSEGEGWQKPSEQDEVNVSLVAKVHGAAAPFYTSSVEGVDFTLSEGFLCKAVKIAVLTMKKGENAVLVVKPEYGFGATGRTPDVPPNSTLELVLTLNSWKKVEDVLKDGGVMKKTLVASSEYETPNSGAKVQVSYSGQLQDGTVFEKREDAELILDEEHIIPGLDQAILKMKRGETALVTIKPHYAFGAQEHKGELAMVPPNSTVVYTVTLNKIEKAKSSWELKGEEKITEAASAKEKGNEFYKTGKLGVAVKKWERAIDLLNSDSDLSYELKQKAKEIKRSCHLNGAQVHLKNKDWVKAKAACEKVLENDPAHVKALYRRAQAFLGLQEWVEGEMDIKKALEVEPDNKELLALRKRFKASAAAFKEREAKMYSSMFAKMKKLAEKEEEQMKKMGHSHEGNSHDEAGPSELKDVEMAPAEAASS